MAKSDSGKLEPADARTNLTRRDAGMLRMMGWFFGVFGFLVLAGLFWEQSHEERMVNLGASILLIAAGGGAMLIAGRWARRKP